MPYVVDAPGTLSGGRYLPDHGGGLDDRGTEHGISYMPSGFDRRLYRWSRLRVFLPDPFRTGRSRPARCGVLFVVNHQGYTSTSPVKQWVEMDVLGNPIAEGNYYRRMAMHALLNNVAVVAVGVTGTDTELFEPGGVASGLTPEYDLRSGQRVSGRGTYDTPGDVAPGLDHFGVPGSGYLNDEYSTPAEQMALAVQFVRRYEQQFGLYMTGGVDGLGLTCVLGYGGGARLAESAIYSPDVVDVALAPEDPRAHSSRLHSAVIMDQPYYFPGFRQDSVSLLHAALFPAAVDPENVKCSELVGLQDSVPDHELAASASELMQRGWDGLWSGAPDAASQRANASRRPVVLVNWNVPVGTPQGPAPDPGPTPGQSIVRPDETGPQAIVTIDLFDPQYYTIDGTTGDYVLRKAIQVGYKLNGSGGPTPVGDSFLFDPADAAMFPTWQKAGGGLDPVKRRAIRFIWTGPIGSNNGRGVLFGNLGSNGSQITCVARQADETSTDGGGWVGVEWFEMHDMDVYAGNNDTITVGTNSFGTNERKPLLWWFEDCDVWGRDYDSQLAIGHRYAMSFYQTSIAAIRTRWRDHSLLQEHQKYHRGSAYGWDGGEPYSYHEDCEFEIVGSQHDKYVNRPDTQSILDQGLIPGDNAEFPFKSHLTGTPYAGDITITHVRTKFKDSGSANPTQRGSGVVVAESFCGKLIWMEDCTCEAEGQTPANGIIGQSVVTDYVEKVGSDEQPGAGYPPGVAWARGYSPGTGGQISPRPGLIRTVLLRCDFTSNASSENKAMLRAVDGISDPNSLVTQEFEAYECSFWGEAKIGLDVDGVCWVDNQGPAQIQRAIDKGLNVGDGTGLPGSGGLPWPVLRGQAPGLDTGLAIDNDQVTGTCVIGPIAPPGRPPFNPVPPVQEEVPVPPPPPGGDYEVPAALESFADALGDNGLVTQSMQVSGDGAIVTRKPDAPYPFLLHNPAIAPCLHMQQLLELDVLEGTAGYHAAHSELWIRTELVKELGNEPAMTTSDPDAAFPSQLVSDMVTHPFDIQSYPALGDEWADSMLAWFLEADPLWDAPVGRTPYYILVGGDNGEGRAPAAGADEPGPWERQFHYNDDLRGLVPTGSAWLPAVSFDYVGTAVPGYSSILKNNLTRPSKPGGADFLETAGPEMVLGRALREAEKVDSDRILLAKFCVPDSAFHDQDVTSWDPTGEENDWSVVTAQGNSLFEQFFGSAVSPNERVMEFSLVAAAAQFAPLGAPEPWPGLEPLCIFVDVPLNVANASSGLAAKLVAFVTGIRAHPDIVAQRAAAGLSGALPVVFGQLPARVPTPPGGFLELAEAREEVLRASAALAKSTVVERTAGLSFESGEAYWDSAGVNRYGVDMFVGYAAANSGKYPKAGALGVSSAEGRVVTK